MTIRMLLRHVYIRTKSRIDFIMHSAVKGASANGLISKLGSTLTIHGKQHLQFDFLIQIQFYIELVIRFQYQSVRFLFQSAIETEYRKICMGGHGTTGAVIHLR